METQLVTERIAQNRQTTKVCLILQLDYVFVYGRKS